jgi:hypothetical protein
VHVIECETGALTFIRVQGWEHGTRGDVKFEKQKQQDETLPRRGLIWKCCWPIPGQMGFRRECSNPAKENGIRDLPSQSDVQIWMHMRKQITTHFDTDMEGVTDEALSETSLVQHLSEAASVSSCLPRPASPH